VATATNGKQRVSIAIISLAVLLITNVGAVTWWGAKTTTNQDVIKDNQERIINKVQEVSEAFVAHKAEDDERDTNLKERFDRIEVQ
jgi:flagellar basal body-associated protein FliL